MLNTNQLPIDELALFWVTTMIKHLRVLPRKFNETNLVKKFVLQDLLQFKAIAAQLEMLFCTRPVSPWEIFFWRQNFDLYLNQIVRRSNLFFQHLSQLYE